MGKLHEKRIFWIPKVCHQISKEKVLLEARLNGFQMQMMGKLSFPALGTSDDKEMTQEECDPEILTLQLPETHPLTLSQHHAALRFLWKIC